MTNLIYLNAVKDYENKIGIKSWAEEDRPREKLAGQGRRALTDAELIAILIGSGSRNETAVELSKRILHHYDNDLNKLGKASITELSNFKGIGEAKAISIIAALEIGRRRNEFETKTPDMISTSKDAYNIMRRHLMDLNHEEFWIILTGPFAKSAGERIDQQGRFIPYGYRPEDYFRRGIAAQASNIILIHNHPSGSLKPSQHDILLTKKIVDAGAILDIKILDHLIISDQGYLSFADEGLF